MTDQQDVIEALRDLGVLDGIGWAYRSAAERTLERHDEADGHTATLFGTTRHTLFCDRLDRVFGCGRYTPPTNETDEADQDVLFDQLTAGDVATWPTIDSALVTRADLRGSPGWKVAGYRFLLASYPVGKLDEVPWAQKSQTKQDVARQGISLVQGSLFEEVPTDELPELPATLTTPFVLDMPTFVVGHALDAVTGEVELVVGSPRMNKSGGRAWHWREALLWTPPLSGASHLPTEPLPTGPDAAPDAIVRLRRRETRLAEDATEQRLS